MRKGNRLVWVAVAMLLTTGAVDVRATGAAGPGPRDAGPTSSPVPTATAGPGCPASYSACIYAVLKMINGDRAQYKLAPYTLAMTQSAGRAGCAGAYGHSVAMARSGLAWHTNPKYLQASFPQDICIPHQAAAENVGVAASGHEMADLSALNTMMMGEPHSRRACRAATTHACNILSHWFHQVGIGIYYANDTTWLTEDFTG